MHIGCHLTIAKGYKKAAELALEIGANVFQFFSRNPRGSTSKELDMEDIEEMERILKENDFGPLLAHAPYIINLGSYKGRIYGMAKGILKEDYERLNEISIPYFTFHPGNHVGKGPEYGVQRIIDALNEIITGNETTMLLLETMSGKGTELGRNFQEIRDIIDGVKYSELVGVCLDTCHIYSAGYDIVNDLDGVLGEFDDIIGLEKLKAIHLNDSMVEFDSGKDRHAKIGEGTIGLEAIKNIINHPNLKDLPFYLETPNELEGYKEEIELLRKLRG
ncbi:putative endonuclease 4 [[Clostridium] ultunense Esp]|uniref:Probable endonuclease 4 n=1 Tax=[Clostridium] ultunense Esp TaxID=1288971 RepID=M1Z458_9FIRM|nr:deoxyribonuclease IV [Schnuerera ultunensis]CCQ92826.1 putative endonuclease 4 [[Clostridium] ultunense Esp]SHD75841.1 putative endonuclease 4 [[Clostridium] ultunense Esp]